MTTLQIIQQYSSYPELDVVQSIITIYGVFIVAAALIGVFWLHGYAVRIICGVISGVVFISLMASIVTYPKKIAIAQIETTEKIDAVLKNEEVITDAEETRKGVRFFIGKEEETLMGTPVKPMATLIVISKEGAKKLNALFLEKRGITLLPEKNQP